MSRFIFPPYGYSVETETFTKTVIVQFPKKLRARFLQEDRMILCQR